ncbi:MAG: glycoside hydrolase family 25 protein [Pseudooceanicola sp.]
MRARLLALSAFVALLSACDTETRTAPVIRPVAGLPAAFGDTDPHDWAGQTPASYPVHGTDVSRFQGRVYWDRAAAAGLQFAWIKATEGGDRVDPEFRANWRGAARAGIPRGAYHFYYWCRPAIEQARWFIQNVPATKGALPPVLDMEWTPFSPTCTIRPPAETVRAEALVFLRALEAHYGTRPVIYSTPDFFERNQMHLLAGYHFWLRSTAAPPAKTYPDHAWTFWQYTGTGLAPGFYTKVDLNLFNGSRAAFQKWLARHRQ